MFNGKLKLLIVDDEPNIVKALKRIFDGMHYTILTAVYSSAALNILSENKVDIILCDQQMPEMTGVELLKFAKSIQPDAIRILITGSSDMNVAISAINEGNIFYFFTKPWKNEEVVSVIEKSLLQKREKEKKDGLYQLMGLNKKDLLDVSNKLNKISDYIISASSEKTHQQSSRKIPVFEDDNIILISIPDILYVAAGENDISIVTNIGIFSSDDTLNTWEEKLQYDNFFRCHRGYIVNIDQIEKITQWFNGAYNINIKGLQEIIPVSRNYAKKLKEILHI